MPNRKTPTASALSAGTAKKAAANVKHADQTKARRGRPDLRTWDVDEAGLDAARRNENPKDMLPAVELWSQRFKDFLSRDQLIDPLTMPLKELTIELERFFLDFKNRDGEEYRAKNVWKAFIALDWYLSKNHRDQRQDRPFALVRSCRFSALRNLVERLQAEGDPIPKTAKSVESTVYARFSLQTSPANRCDVGAENRDLGGHASGPHLVNKMPAATTLSNVPPNTAAWVRPVLKRVRQLENYEPKRARLEGPERHPSIVVNGMNVRYSSRSDVVFPECAVQ
ncbi:hypothetical protein HK102_006539 [Quaeritorhiza haematococci]|nr:hypothetical protein HK102_006539 [Quaeritorhiza haematococci]